MKKISANYKLIAALLAVFIIASLLIGRNAGDPAGISSAPQADEPSSYIPKSEPVRVETPSQPVPQQVVIRFASEATEAERQAYIESIGGTVVESIDSLDTVVVNVPEEVAQTPLPESETVAVSEADYYVSALDDANPVNDPHYADQWALPAIAAPEAWASMPADAPDVTVAVIDSGICVTHPDLAGRVVSGWDFIEDDAVPQDDFGHGCSVSGVIAANMNDSIGIAGIAPNAKIMPLRVLDGGGVGSYSDVAAAVVYAADHGAQVINLSLGGSSPSSTLESAIDYAVANGVIVVAAAGNNGTEGVLYPAAYNSVIAVGSIDPNLQPSSFSNYGVQVDVWAPGRDIMTTKRTGDYGLVSGTSFAAPYVAGAEAVYMALSRTPIFGGGLLTFADPIAATPEPTAVVEETPTSEPVAEIDSAAVLDQLKALYSVPSNYEASIQNIEQAGGTMFGLFVIPAQDGGEGGPSAHYFTAKQNGDEVTVSKEYTTQFSEALDALNAAGAVNQGLVEAFNSPTAQGDGSAELGLPWTYGLSATFLNGPHGDGFNPASTVLSALDFGATTDNKVRAAREGFAQKIVCSGEVESSWVIITHPDGWRTSYYQVTNIQVDTDGRQVARNEWIGDVAPNSTAAFRCGGSSWTVPLVHFAVLDDGKQVKIEGFDIGGWTVAGSGAGGTLTRVSDAAVVAVNGSVANNGAVGTDFSCEATSVPLDYVKCSNEGGTCSFTGTETVYFGSASCFTFESLTGPATCNSATLGNPAGDNRSCYVDAKSTTLAPACPQSGGVILYWTKDYSCTNGASDAGYRLQSTSGSQDYGVDTAFNDKASALRVPSGWSVMLYGGAGNSGEQICLNSDVSDLSLLSTFPNTSTVINDGVSSMQVFTNSDTCNGLFFEPPTPLLPANGSSNANGFSPIFQWAAAPMGGSYYAEWWDTDTPGTKNICNWSTALFCNAGTTLAAGAYSWHVRAYDGVDYTGWSPTFTFTVRTASDAVFLETLYTTDDLGPTGGDEDGLAPLEDVAANAYDDIFAPGDPIRFYIIFTNEFPGDQTITFNWDIYDPAGNLIPELSEELVSSSSNANNTYYWYRSHAVPDDSIRGTYTFVGTVTHGSNVTTQSHKFTVETGNPAVEVYDAFSTDDLGAASITDGPLASAPLDVISEADPTYNSGDGIRLYIDSYNDVSEGVLAVFDWSVTDGEGRHIPELEWHGNLNVPSNHTWWSLPATIPSNASSGTYKFTGSITHNGVTTSQTQNFTVTGASAPANDVFASAVTIGSVPYTTSLDTWNTPNSVNDPQSGCGGFNSNTVWYKYTPASNGRLEIDTTGSNYDVEVGVWTGTIGNFTEVACNNEKDQITNSVLLEDVPVTGGTTYYIELSDVGTPGGGKLKLHVDFASSAALTNDNYSNAIIITNNTTINNAGANITPLDVRTASTAGTDPLFDACNRLQGRASVWYRYTTTLPGTLELNTSGSDYDTMLAVWGGTPGVDAVSLGCNDDIGGSGVWDVDSSLTVSLAANTSYYIEIAEFNGAASPVSGAAVGGLGNKPPSDISAEFSGGTLHLFSKFNPAPMLDSPADGTYLTSPAQPTLSLDTSPLPGGASTYHFQVDDSDDFSSVLVDVPNSASTSYALTSGEALLAGTYYWRAAAKDAGSNYSAWSPANVLYVTSLLSPANNSVTSNSKPTFSWGAAAGALEYHLQVDETPDFSTALEIDRFQTSGTSYTPTAALVADDHYWRLQVRTASGWGFWTPPWKFTTLQALTAPALISPANGASTSDTTPTFTWGSVASGNTYEIQVDNENTFADPKTEVHVTIPGESLIYQVVTPLGDGTFYWRVRAINVIAEPGPWSVTNNVVVDTLPSDAPLLNLPANNSFTSSSKPTLSVFAVPGATSYTFYVDPVPFTDPNDIPLVYAYNVTSTSYTLNDSQMLPHGLYYWKARAKDAAGNNSAWSEVRSFQVTPMTAPARDGYVTTATPAFTWASVTGALEYHIQVWKYGTLDGGDILEMERYQASGTSYTSPALDYGSHYWRVRVRKSAGWDPWAPLWKFTVSPALTSPPTLASPAAAALLADNTPSLAWNKVMDDDRYEVQIDNLSTFASPEQTYLSGYGGLNYTAGTLPDGVYYWRVRTNNYLSVPGTWSTSRSFTVDTTPPAAPTLSSPADAGIAVGTPTFSWATTATASKYQFEYDTVATFDSTSGHAFYISAELSTTSHKPTPDMTVPASYYWHVKAKDAAGNWGPWSAARSVTVNPPIPTAPILTAPAASAATNDNTPLFTWNAVSGTSITYEIQFGTSTAFTPPLPQSATSLAVTNYTPGTPFTDGVIYWRVRAYNNAVPPVAGAWSASRSFTVDTSPPLAPNLSAPADASAVTTTPAFSWASVATASKYQFEYDDNADLLSPVYTSAELSTTSHTPPAMTTPPLPKTYYWHARAKDAAGNWGPWSTTRLITINPATPVAPALTSPVNALVTTDTTPDFTWGSVTNGNTYDIQFGTSTAFTPPLLQSATSLAVTNYTPGTPFTDGLVYWRVRAVNVASVAGAWSAARSFTVDTTGPLAPALSSPADAAIVVGTPTFSWASAATATKYQFEYDTDSGFANPITYTSAELTGTSHKPTPDMAVPATYYWHVRARDAAGNWGAWSAYRTVTVNPATPVAPTLTAPVNALITVDTTPDFTWNTVAGTGITYEIQFGASTAFTPPLPQSATSLAVTNYTPGTPFTDGVVYWRVRAYNNAVPPVAGAWSASRSFTVDTTGPLAPALSSPADAAIVVGTPTFSWASAATATKYQFEYDTDSGFANPITYTSAELTGTSHKPTPDMAVPATYYWHVRARDAAGNWGAWSAYRTVTVNPPTPAAPALTSPAASAVLGDSTPDFTWGAVSGTGITYEIQFGASTAFTPPLPQSATSLAVTNYTPGTPFTPDGVVYWRVRAYNNAVPPVAGAWSASRSFTVDTTPPAAPSLSSPADAAIVVGTPAFSWASVTGASRYQFEYDTDAGFANPITYTSTELSTTSHTPPAMAVPATYYWHVRAKDALGNWGPWSATRSVTVNPPIPAAPTLTSPVASAILGDATPDFTWGAVSGTGITYEIQFGASTAFTPPLPQSATSLAVTNYTPGTPFTDGVIYWRVRAYNNAVPPVAGAWSASRSFTVDTTPPAMPSLSSPADAAIVTGTPAFSWASVTGATRYQFEYDTDAGFANPITYTSAELTTTSHTPPAMTTPVTYYWHVRAKDAAGNWSTWSAARSVTVNPATPAAPTLTSPAASAVTTDTTPDFTWSAVAGTGITYEIQFAAASTFATPLPQSAAGLAVTNYTPGTPFTPDGVIYWRVRAYNNAVPPVAGAWSTSRSFTVDTTPPAAPTLNSPADAGIVTGTPAFSWASTATASKYQFEYDTDAGFANPITYTSAELTGTSHTPPAMAVPAAYYWHVRAKDAAGNWSPWSATRSVTVNPATPTAPTLTAPANALATNDNTPLFTWNAVSGTGITYEIQFAAASSFASPLPQSATGIAVTNYTPGTPFTDGVVYWRVRAYNNAIPPVAGAWSTSRSFTVDTTPPAAPTLNTPAAGASVIGTPAFTWAGVAGAIKYQFQYDDSADMLSPVYTSAELTTTNHTPPTMTPPSLPYTYYWQARAKDAAGNWGPWAAARTVQINPATPVAPILTAPANAQATNDTTPDFTWGSVVNGNTYEIQFGTSTSFTPPLTQSATGLAVTNYTPGTPFTPDGVYYWRVRAVNTASVAGAWSASRSFTIDTVAIAAPNLSSPANAASVTGTPAFSWASVTGASRYQFEYDNNSDFSSPTYTSAELTTTSHTPPTISLGTYSWHVRAKDAAGNWSVWSASRTVSVTPLPPTGVPTLLGPANSAIVLDLTPTFTWSAVTGTANYQIQIDKNSTFSSTDVDTLTPNTDFTPVSNLAEGTYYWRVRKVDIYGGVGTWSSVWRFSANQVIPLAVTLPLSAQSNEFDTATPTFTWGAVEFGVTYQIQVDNDRDFASPSFDDTAETTSRILTEALANGDYFWRVRAFNEYETPGPWSETWTFRINILPAAPTLLLPADEFTSSSGALAFSWQGVTGAEEYQFQLADNEDFGDPAFDKTTAEAGFTPSQPLGEGAYFWRVRAVNDIGSAGAWSEIRTFTVAVPLTAPVLLSPGDDAIETTASPTFSWETVSNGDSYQIQVDDDEDFGSPEFDDTAPQTTRELVTPLTEGTHFWRVRAVSASGTTGEWSETRTFTIAVPLAAPVLLTPEVDATDTTGLPAFSWEAVINGVTYQIQVDNNEDFSSPEADNVAANTERDLGVSLENGLYYWRVRAISMDGIPGEWSLVWSFTVSVP